MKKVRVGMIGSGFAAAFHMKSYKQVRGIDVQVIAVTSHNQENAVKFAAEHNIPQVYQSVEELLANPDIDVVDLCVPNHQHATLAIAAARSKKHIICEKPLTGFFEKPSQSNVSDEAYAVRALQEVMKSSDDVFRAVGENEVKFMYAENWVYAPVISKAKRLLWESGGTILDIRAEQSHSGSHAKASKRVETSGGGSLLLLGAHPVAAAIHLKHEEGKRKYGVPIHVKSVSTELGFMRNNLDPWLVADWVDVETWASSILTFTDGTKAIVTASFEVLGGVKNVVEIHTSNSVLKCNMNQNDSLMTYAPDENVFGNEFITEKLATKAGWNYASIDDEWEKGYHHEIQDFMECIVEDREPLSGLPLAREVVEVIYSSYLSAASGSRIEVFSKINS
ncbi:Gfo/Idh/MocA family protein [Oceanobacillus arenosus]|nr:Gfo/Idh/MocA family oxidoreductase [Oceanobacillus arenosus]